MCWHPKTIGEEGAASKLDKPWNENQKSPGRSFRRVLAGGPIAGQSALGIPEKGVCMTAEQTGTTIAPQVRLVGLANWCVEQSSALPQCYP